MNGIGYLVTYLSMRKRPRADEEPPKESTVVLLDVHPLVWASWPDVIYREHFFTLVLRWQEFPCPPHVWKAISAGHVLTIESIDDMIANSGEQLIHDEVVPVGEREHRDGLQKARHNALLAYRKAQREGRG